MKLIRELLEVKDFDRWFSDQGKKPAEDPQDKYGFLPHQWHIGQGSRHPDQALEDYLYHEGGNDLVYSITKHKSSTGDYVWTAQTWDMEKDDAHDAEVVIRSRQEALDWCNDKGIVPPAPTDFEGIDL